MPLDDKTPEIKTAQLPSREPFVIPLGECVAAITTFDGRPLDDVSDGEVFRFAVVRRRRNMRNIYTGESHTEDCSLAYNGMLVGFMNPCDRTIRIRSLVEKHGYVHVHAAKRGADDNDEPQVVLLLPPGAWFNNELGLQEEATEVIEEQVVSPPIESSCDTEPTNATSPLRKWVLRIAIVLFVLGFIGSLYEAPNKQSKRVATKQESIAESDVTKQEAENESKGEPEAAKEEQEQPETDAKDEQTKSPSVEEEQRQADEQPIAETEALPDVQEEQPEEESGYSSSGSGTHHRVPVNYMDEPTDEPTVFITRGKGKRYHLDPNCEGLEYAWNIDEVTLDVALEKGKTPCKLCAR